MTLAGLILAAGESRRMGSPKALLTLEGETFLDRLIGRFRGLCSEVVVILGAEADRIRSGIARGSDVSFVVNENYQLGQLSSLQCGLRAVAGGNAGVLFTLVDHPNVQAGTLTRLVEEPLALIAVPRYRGRRGHPVCFSASLAREFLELPPGSQAKAVMAAHADEVRFVDVDDPGVTQDIDTPEDYQQLLESMRR